MAEEGFTDEELEEIIDEALAKSAKDRLLPLKGLEAVTVMVEPLPEEAKEDGLADAMIQEKAESRLREAGIVVKDEFEIAETPGNACVAVIVNPIRLLPEAYAFNVEVNLTQLIVLAREPSMKPIFCETWESGLIATCSIEDMPAHVLKCVAEKIDCFIRDFSEVNSAAD